MKKFLIVISVILLIAIISVTTVGCKKPEPIIPNPLDIDAGSRPDVESQILSAELALINAGLEADASEAEIEEAVLSLFYAADRVQRQSEFLFKISDGNGYAKTGAEGYMTVRGFYLRNGTSFYSQSAGEVTSANVGTVIPNATKVARNMLDQLNRTYTDDMQTFYREKAADGEAAKRPNVSASDKFPYVSADFGDCDSETFNMEQWMVEARILEEEGELTNFAFVPEAIKNAAIFYNADEKFYRIDFELDTSNKNEAYNNVVAKPRDGLREASTSDDLDYVVYKLSLEVWDNGYIRSISSTENWEATLKISFIKLKGVSDSQNITKYYWDWDEAKDVIDDCEAYDEIDTADDFLDALKWFE